MWYEKETYIEKGKVFFFTRVYLTAPEESEREKIVLVHGLGMSGVYMHKLAMKLSEKYAVYVPDLPGFGNSSKPPHVLNIQELAEALHIWGQAFPVEKAWYLGNSAGCQIITDFAIHYPHLIKGAVLQGPVMDPYMRNKSTQLQQFLKLSSREPASQILIMLKDYINCGIKRVWKTFKYALQYKTEDFLPHVKVPVLVVRGEKDKLVSQEWAEEAARLLSKGRLKIIPEEAHTVNYTAPRLLAGITGSFIESSKKEVHESTLV